MPSVVEVAPDFGDSDGELERDLDEIGAFRKPSRLLVNMIDLDGSSDVEGR